MTANKKSEQFPQLRSEMVKGQLAKLQNGSTPNLGHSKIRLTILVVADVEDPEEWGVVEEAIQEFEGLGEAEIVLVEHV